MGLLTTAIGAFPKPSYLKVPDWFGDPKGTATSNPTARWASAMDALGGDVKEVIRRATKDVVEAQISAGIDIPTDGEVPRENYIHYHCRHLNGIDFHKLTERCARAGDYSTRVPTFTGPVSLKHDYIVEDWNRAQAFCDQPVKMTMPGPMTTTDTTADAFFGDSEKQGAALADALNQCILSLAHAGCRHIQLDEPVFVRYVPAALDYCIEHVERAFHKCPASVMRTVHICCSYRSHLDEVDCPKAPKDAYLQIGPSLDESSLMAVSLEDAHRPNDLALFEMFQKTTLILGCFDIGKSPVESVDSIRERLLKVLEHIDAERLIAAPDCGLGLLGWDLAITKLTNLADAAASV